MTNTTIHTQADAATRMLAQLVRNARCCDALEPCSDCRRRAQAVRVRRRREMVGAA